MSITAPLRNFSVIGLHFIRRPIDDAAPEGAVGIVDNGHRRGWSDRQVAKFKDGQWVNPKGKALQFKPTYWTVLDDEAHASAT